MTSPKLTGDRCRCTACGELFNSTFAFDKHRIALQRLRAGARHPVPATYQRTGTDLRCFDTAAMAEMGFSKNSSGFWITRSRLNADLEGDMATYYESSRPEVA